jgi:hypothetical protein
MSDKYDKCNQKYKSIIFFVYVWLKTCNLQLIHITKSEKQIFFFYQNFLSKKN